MIIEIKKLYGHPNDITTMAISHYIPPVSPMNNVSVDGPYKGVFLVTACKSRDANTATLILWNIENKEYVYYCYFEYLYVYVYHDYLVFSLEILV